VADSEYWGEGQKVRRGVRGGNYALSLTLKKFYAEIMHFCATFLLSYKMHPVNEGRPLNPAVACVAQLVVNPQYDVQEVDDKSKPLDKWSVFLDR